MKTANNPFLATIQNKTSTTSYFDNRSNNTPTSNGNNNNTISSSNNNNNINSNSNTNINNKGNKKLRRQTISDPHAYIRYIHSLLGDKCIPKSSASTLAKSTATARATPTRTGTTTAATTSDDKSQKQCQQQQQLQQISLQFQGITLYDDDVAKSQNSSHCNNNNITNNGTRNNNFKIDNRNNDNYERQTLENQQTALRIVLQQQQHNQQREREIEAEKRAVTERQQKQMGIASKLAAVNISYNNNNSKKQNNINDCYKANINRDLWMGTYPTTRVKKIPISSSLITNTTTTNATRMTSKIAPTSITTPAPLQFKSALRKHHSFHIQPTYIMHKQLNMKQQQQEQQHESKIKLTTCAPMQATVVRDVDEVEQQLMTSRYHATFGGPLVFRPLTLNEKHAFKPIARPDGMSNVSVMQEQKHQQQQQQQNKNDHNILSEEECEAEAEVQSEKSEQSEEFLEEIREITTKLSASSSSSSSGTITPTPTNSPTLHPAASLEVLEALTQSNPELIYAAIQPGSRLNLHTQLSALNQTHYGTHMPEVHGEKQLRAKLHAKLCDNEHIEQHENGAQAAHLRRKNVYFADNDITINAVDAMEKPDEDFCFYELPLNDAENIEHNNNSATDIDIDTDNDDISPNSTIILNSNNKDGQVKYLVKQNLHEIHI